MLKVKINLSEKSFDGYEDFFIKFNKEHNNNFRNESDERNSLLGNVLVWKNMFPDIEEINPDNDFYFFEEDSNNKNEISQTKESKYYLSF